MVDLSTSAEIVIERPLAEVWAYVSDPTNQDHWVEGMSSSEIVGGGPIGRGTQVRGFYSFGGQSAPVLMTITEFREGRRLAFEAAEGPFPFSGLLTLERADSRTTSLTNTMTAGSDHIVTTIMFTLFRPLTKRMMTNQLRTELSQLKSILEAG